MLSIASYCCLVTKLGLSLQPRALQPVRLPSPSLSPRVCSNSCPLSLWGYLTISSSATLFSWLQSFPASGSFPMSWLFTSGDQSIGASASASVLPVNIQSLFPFRIDWFDLLVVHINDKNLFLYPCYNPCSEVYFGINITTLSYDECFLSFPSFYFQSVCHYV